MPLSGHGDVALFECRRLWYRINKNLENNLIIASLKSQTKGIPGLRLLLSSLPGSALRRMLNHPESLAMSTCQQAFSKPGFVNYISKDTHLAFYISFSPNWACYRYQNIITTRIGMAGAKCETKIVTIFTKFSVFCFIWQVWVHFNASFLVWTSAWNDLHFFFVI